MSPWADLHDASSLLIVLDHLGWPNVDLYGGRGPPLEPTEHGPAPA
jgi:hypothetical protein